MAVSMRSESMVPSGAMMAHSGGCIPSRLFFFLSSDKIAANFKCIMFKKTEGQVLFLSINRLKNLQLMFELQPFCSSRSKPVSFEIIIQKSSVTILKPFL